MSKYAVIICSSHSYLMGLNAILNGLDYYEVKDIDVYIVSSLIMKEYLEYVKDKFVFPIYYEIAEDVCAGYPITNIYWADTIYVWAKYPMALKIKDKYTSVLHLDADCMIVDDISKYFSIVENTDYILIPQNSCCALPLSIWKVYPKEEIGNLCFGRPVQNFLFFYNAKRHEDLINYVWSERNNIRLEKNSGLEPCFFLEGLFALNKLDNVFTLPGSLWLADTYNQKAHVNLEKHDKYRLVNPFGDRLQVVHGRYWNKGASQYSVDMIDKNQFPVEYYNAATNLKNHTILTDFLNFDWKVSLNEIKEMNNHYRHFCNL